MPRIEEATYISRDDALAQLKQQMEGQSSLFANLDQNPLPDAFELRVQAESLRGEDVDRIVAEIERDEGVETVEYGRQWLDRFTAIFDLVRLAGYSIGGLFFLAAIFIVANTIRLVLYSRREEIEIMQLVGATDRFITTPLYFEGLLQGAFGGLIGLAILYGTYIFIKTKVDAGLTDTWFAMRFLPLKTAAAIVCASMFIGWLGCFVSLRQFFKNTTPK
jgi:cell division transport system permease protein